MSILQLPPRPDYTRAALELLEDLASLFPDERMVLLTGSAAAGQADQFSSLDLFLIVPEKEEVEVRQRLKSRPRRCRIGQRELSVHIDVQGLASFEAALSRKDDLPLAVLRQGHCLEDRLDCGERLIQEARSIPDGVWHEKALAEFGQLRKRQASIAWSLRRGQPFLVLEDVTRFLSYALRTSIYLDHEVPPSRKWLFEVALRTQLGRRLRPDLLLLFSRLNQLAVLGGSRSLRENLIYQQLEAIRARIEAGLVQVGGEKA